jgi:LETM1 and EF-hand domain-containing protein 1
MEIAAEIKSDLHSPYLDDESVVGVVNRVLFRKLPEMPASDDQITADDFDAIEDVVEKLGKDTRMVIEREEIKDLKAEISDYIEDVHELQAIAQRAGELKIKVKESKGARLLFTKLNNMVGKLDEEVTSVDSEEKTHVQHSLVATEELMGAVRKLRDVKDPAKLERIASVLAKLDDDKDGKIEVDDLVKVIDVVGREHIDLSSKQLEEIVSMLAKEEFVEEKGKAAEKRTNVEPPESKI